jgi:hypothetical protein
VGQGREAHEMSHVDKLKLRIYNLGLLASSADAVGMEMVEQSTYAWFGTHMGDHPLPEGFKPSDLGKCDYVLRVKNGRGTEYEVGVVAAKDGQGGYELLFDFWGSRGAGLMAVAGRNLCNLTREYRAQVTEAEYRRKGLRPERRLNEQKKLVVYARGR